MIHYYENVPGLGNVALSRHAEEEAQNDHITDEDIQDVLFYGTTTEEGFETLWKEKDGIRLVIITPTPFTGAKLVRTMYRIQKQARF